MEILVGLLIIALVIALSRLWSNACEESTSDPSPGAPAYLSANSAPNNWLLYDAMQGADDSNSSVAVSEPSTSDNSSQQQDCSQDMAPDTSGGDCSCPTDSSSYDSSACSVDPGNTGDST